MKAFTLLAGMLAIAVGIAYAQTTGTASGIGQYVALSSSSGGTGTSGATGANTTWFIDTVNRLVVLCAQSAPAASGDPPSFTCTAQAAPLAIANAASAAGGSGGSTGAGTGTASTATISPFR
jgi:hypothetical protein